MRTRLGIARATWSLVLPLLLLAGSGIARAGAVITFDDLGEKTTVNIQGIPNPGDYDLVPSPDGESWSLTIKNAVFGINPGLVGVFVFLEPKFEDPKQGISDAVFFDVINNPAGGPMDLKIDFMSDPEARLINPGNIYGSTVETGLAQTVPLPPDLIPGPNGPYYPGGPVPDGISVIVKSDVVPEPSTFFLAALAIGASAMGARRRARKAVAA